MQTGRTEKIGNVVLDYSHIRNRIFTATERRRMHFWSW